jgi:hypothetical protein
VSKLQNFKSEYLRASVAQEAARLIQEHGLEGFRAAKNKAAERFGAGSRRSLPTNQEIELALAEWQRIFRAEQHPLMLLRLRKTATTVMRQLQAFRPRLVGAVLSGNATEHSPVDLHLFSDAAEEVGENLYTQAIAHQFVERRYRLRRNSLTAFPGCRFYFSGIKIIVAVFPERLHGHAPLSPIDGKPMQRANLCEVERLLKNH